MEKENKPVYTYSPASGYSVNNKAESELKSLRSVINAICFSLLLSVFLSALAKRAISLALGLVFDITVLPTGQVLAHPALTYIISAAAYCVQLMVPTRVLILLLGKRPDVAPVGKADSGRVVLGIPVLISLGIFGSVAANLIVSFLAGLDIHYAWPEQSISTPFDLIMSVLVLAVLPALIEEYVFRGIVYGALVPFGARMAILGSALFFALAHFNLLKFINALFIGLFLGFLVYRTGCLAVGIVLHFTNNFVSLVISYTQQTVGLPDGVAMLFYAVVCLLGIVSAVYVAKKDKDTFTIQEEDMLNTLTVKIKAAFSSSGFIMAALVLAWVMLSSGRIA